LADYILGTLGFDVNSIDKSNQIIDHSVLFNLR
jgi:hypothetical protein